MIQNVVFDIGGVLVDLRPKPLIRLLSSYGAGQLSLEQVVARICLVEHERGELNGAALLANMATLVPEAVAAEDLKAKWLDMFVVNQPMVELAHALADSHKVLLLSNVGDLHWMHLCREYGLHRIGAGALPSFLAGASKPDPAIYAEAERRFALEPRATIFIDDREENVAAARERGWQALRYESPHRTRAALRAAGVVIDSKVGSGASPWG